MYLWLMNNPSKGTSLWIVYDLVFRTVFQDSLLFTEFNQNINDIWNDHADDKNQDDTYLVVHLFLRFIFPFTPIPSNETPSNPDNASPSLKMIKTMILTSIKAPKLIFAISLEKSLNDS
jgi:hypothetical protein